MCQERKITEYGRVDNIYNGEIREISGMTVQTATGYYFQGFAKAEQAFWGANRADRF